MCIQMGMKLIFESKLYMGKDQFTLPDDERSISRNVANVNIRDPSNDKNLPIMSVFGLINQYVFKTPYCCL